MSLVIMVIARWRNNSQDMSKCADSRFDVIDNSYFSNSMAVLSPWDCISAIEPVVSRRMRWEHVGLVVERTIEDSRETLSPNIEYSLAVALSHKKMRSPELWTLAITHLFLSSTLAYRYRAI